MFELMPLSRSQRSINHFWNDFDKNFFGDFNRSMEQFRTDILDNGDSYLLQAELPGFNREDISLNLEGDYLTISAEHKEDTEEKNDQYLRRERHYGSFSRCFDISGIQADSVSATYQNGILEVTLPKTEEKKPNSRTIEIR